MNRLLRAVLARARAGGAEAGSAIIEFVFVAVVVMVPLVYLIAAVATVQRTELASTQAARNAGRAFATSDTAGDADRRARAAVELAMQSQGLSASGADLHYVASGHSCDDRRARITPQLSPGSEFTVCVVRTVALPGVPSVLAGRGVRTVGVYVVHVDDFREVDR